MSARRGLEVARLAALFAFGLVVALHYGRMGFMPLDQSICFDGGWRILCGQVPFRDYTAPNGFTVHALQALFFAVFGVNWFAYVLHAALINGLAVVLVDRLLVLLGLERWASSVFALCSAVVFYPAFGVPYMDQHAFFFSLAAFVLAIAGVKCESKRARKWCWLAVPPMLALAYLSKQIPSTLFVPAIVVIAAFASRERGKALKQLATSALVVVIALVALALLLRVDWRLVDTYWRRLPTEEGVRRLAFVPDTKSLLARFEETRTQFGLWSVTLTHVVGLTGTFAALFGSVRLLRRREWKWSRPVATALAAEFLLVASLLFIAWTSNDKEDGAALVFAASGAAAAAVFVIGERVGPRARWIARGLVIAFACVAVRDALKFERDIVATRKVNDLAFDAAIADSAAPELPASLAYMRWSVPRLVTYAPSDLRDLIEFLRAQPDNFLLLGDSGVLYGLTGKPSIAPSLWFHPGLVFPLPSDPEFANYERALLERVERERVRFLVIEPRVWIGYAAPAGEQPKARLVTLDMFPNLKSLVETRASGERSFGPIRVIELRAN